MSIQWGRALRNGFQGIKVGISVDWENISHGEGAATATVKYYGAVRAHSNDNPTLHMSGAIDGTVDFHNNHGRNGDPDYDVFLIATRSYTYNYGGSEYGSSPGTRTFSARITGTYNGLSPSVSVKSRIPARPFAKPAEQGDCTATYINDGRAKITWSRVSSAGAPVRAVRVIRYEWINGGGRYDNGTVVDRLSARATQYYDNGIEPNRVYYYHVRAYNPAGWGPENHSAQNICTTPAGPSSIHAHVNAAGDAVVVDAQASNNYNDAASGDSVQYELERRVNGGSWQSLASGKSGPSLTDNNPGAGSNQYRVRAVSNYGSQTPLTSDWLTSNTVSTIVPPLAPINLYPNGITVDATEDLTVRYTYRDGGDGAAQTAVKWRISEDFGQSWTEYGPVDTAQTSFAISGGTFSNGSTYQYQIATQAIESEGFGPWSAVATVKCAARPVVVITSPTATTTTGHITAEWTYSQAGGSRQYVAAVVLYAADGVTELERHQRRDEGTSQAFDYYCQDGETYVIGVQAQAQIGIESDVAWVTTTVDIPSPALVEVTPEFQADTGRAVLHMKGANEDAALTLTNLCPIPTFVNGVGTTSANGLWDRDSIAETVVASSDWSAGDGGRSMKLTPESTSVDSRATWGCYDVESGPFELGVEYTVSATCHLDFAQTDVSNPNARSIAVTWHTPEGWSPSLLSPKIPNMDDSTGRVSVTFTIPTDADQYEVRLYNGQSSADPTAVYWDHVMANRGSEPIAYFDGSVAHGTLDGQTGTFEFDWTGAEYDSASTAYRAGEAPATHVSVDRSVDNGVSWVRMAESLDLPVDFVDPIPTVAGANVYRLTSISDEPAYRVNPDVTLYTPSGSTTAPSGDERLGAWTYLSYGPSFSTTLKVRANPQVQPKPSRAASAPAYLGQRMPRARFGTQRSVSYAFSGALFPGDGANSPQEWIRAQLDADIVCLRDAKGRRVFGVLSDMDAPESYELVSPLSFTVTETAFVESYGSALQPVAVVGGQFLGLANNGDGTYTLSLPDDGALQPVGDGTWTLTPGL